MVKQQCLFGTLPKTKVPGRHFLYPESWRKGVKMTEPNRQSGEKEERIIEIPTNIRFICIYISTYSFKITIIK